MTRIKIYIRTIKIMHKKLRRDGNKYSFGYLNINFEKNTFLMFKERNNNIFE